MKTILFLGRGKGKTSKLIKEVLRNKGYLVTFSVMEANRLMKLYPKLQGRVLAADQAKYSLVNLRTTLNKVPPLYVDNADLILESLFCHPITSISITKETKSKRNSKQKA